MALCRTIGSPFSRVSVPGPRPAHRLGQASPGDPGIDGSTRSSRRRRADHCSRIEPIRPACEGSRFGEKSDTSHAGQAGPGSTAKSTGTQKYTDTTGARFTWPVPTASLPGRLRRPARRNGRDSARKSRENSLPLSPCGWHGHGLNETERSGPRHPRGELRDLDRFLRTGTAEPDQALVAGLISGLLRLPAHHGASYRGPEPAVAVEKGSL